MSKNIINPEVFSFFTELSENNNRDWFEKNKILFKSLELEIKEFLSEVNNKLNDHDNIEKAKIFRISRDVRFSNNKTPYKTHFKIVPMFTGQSKYINICLVRWTVLPIVTIRNYMVNICTHLLSSIYANKRSPVI